MKEAKSAIESGRAPAAVGPYSQAVRAGGWLFLSGQIAPDLSGVAAQTKQVLSNLKAVLAEAGLDFSHVVKTTVYLRDMAAFAEMNAVYAESFAKPFPARATVAVAGLPKGALVEIDAVARCE